VRRSMAAGSQLSCLCWRLCLALRAWPLPQLHVPCCCPGHWVGSRCVPVLLRPPSRVVPLSLLRSPHQRETEDVATRKLIAQSKADQEKWLAAITLALSQLGAGAQTLLTHHLQEVVAAVVCVALGTYASREAVTLIRSEIQRRLSQPKLVRETSRQGLLSSVLSSITGLCCRRGPVDGFADVVLEPTLSAALRVLSVSSR
jgi:hypothetical protein